MIIFLQLVSFGLLIMSSVSKTSKNSMMMQALSCAVTGVASLFVGAITGALTGLIGFVRTMVFKKKDDISKKQYMLCLIVFQAINGIITILSFTSGLSFLPLINALLRTHCLWTNNLKGIKWSALEMGIVLGVYYALYGAYIMTAGYIVVTIITTISLMKDIKEEKSVLITAQ